MIVTLLRLGTLASVSLCTYLIGRDHGNQFATKRQATAMNTAMREMCENMLIRAEEHRKELEERLSYIETKSGIYTDASDLFLAAEKERTDADLRKILDHIENVTKSLHNLDQDS